jgi:hypothetical protein
MSDTPETDARTYVPSLGASTVPADFARRLERERDEARHEINIIRNTLSKNGEAVGNGEHDFSIIEMVENLMQSKDYFIRKSDSLERERDEALIDRANGDIATMTINHYERILRERDEWAAMCGRYKQERDEVKEKYRFAVIHWQIGSAKMERERDEARDILRKLLEIIPEPECHDFGHTKEERHTFFEKCPVMERYDALIAQAKDVAK